MKKFLKVLKYSIISILTIILLFVLYVFVSNKMFLEFNNQENIDYLTQNNVLIKDSINGKLFDSDFYKSKVFLLGEIHGSADNQILDKELLFFLNKKLGVKYYIAEMDSITSKKLNNYLSKKTKDEALLKDAVTAISTRIPQQSSQELYEKWSEIYNYNQKLNDSSKISVIGIDKNFDDESKISRDTAMIINFMHAIKTRKLENQKFYGLFGYYHTLQNSINSGKQPFAGNLRKSGFKTTSFVSYTLDSDMYFPSNPNFPTPPDEKLSWLNSDGPFIVVKGINDLKEDSKPNSITLFKINSQHSPYLKSQNLISVKSRVFGENFVPEKNSSTTNYFEYVFLLRNSKALSKLK